MTGHLTEDRFISLSNNSAAIPERLLLAHARGEVLFIAGAGVSMPSGLPDFRALVLNVYEHLDPGVYEFIKDIPTETCDSCYFDFAGLTYKQAAEAKRFVKGDYDVVLGMLERRLDGDSHGGRVRNTITSELRRLASRPSGLHRSLIRLSDRGGAKTLVTTNFDLLLEAAARRIGQPMESYSLGGIPRPGLNSDFNGVLHIHGALASSPSRTSDLILSDQDFGEYYLRRRVVPDFIYDAARLYNIVLVGYSANDPPMRYLLNAVAADGKRFGDLKERFAFISQNDQEPDPISVEDWKSRGITPIPYSQNNRHEELRLTLEQWARLSAINGTRRNFDLTIKRLVRIARNNVGDTDKDLFDHLVGRSDSSEQVRISKLISDLGADYDWLSAINLTVGGYQK